jgi:hypothetical protein
LLGLVDFAVRPHGSGAQKPRDVFMERAENRADTPSQTFRLRRCGENDSKKKDCQANAASQ